MAAADRIDFSSLAEIEATESGHALYPRVRRELLGAALGQWWGAINQRYSDEGDIALIFGLIETDRGLAFGSQEVAWFYLQSSRAPAVTLGRLTARSTIYDGSGEGKPRLFYTMGMDVPVPAPIPEPGTFVLLTTGLAAALVNRRYRKQQR